MQKRSGGQPERASLLPDQESLSASTIDRTTLLE